jgi:hypothetical protein
VGAGVPRKVPVAGGVSDGDGAALANKVPDGAGALDTAGVGDAGGRVGAADLPTVAEGEVAAGWLVGGAGDVDPATGERDG